MKNFGSFLTEADVASADNDSSRVNDSLVTVFGRHNPPHLGHKLTFDKANDVAGNEEGDQKFYTSRSFDPKKNPLPYELKLDHLKRMFPEHSSKWDSDDNVKTVLGAASKAGNQGYKNFHFIGDSERKSQMEDLLRKYNGDLYEFDNIYGHSAGDRGDDIDDPIAQMSASRQRKAAMNGDFDGFMESVATNNNYTMEDARELFQALRQFMVKNEDWEVDYRSNKEYIREIYSEGNLFSVGDLVESLSSGLRGHVHRCGANHLIVVTAEGVMFKNFIHDVQAV